GGGGGQAGPIAPGGGRGARRIGLRAAPEWRGRAAHSRPQRRLLVPCPGQTGARLPRAACRLAQAPENTRFYREQRVWHGFCIDNATPVVGPRLSGRPREPRSFFPTRR